MDIEKSSTSSQLEAGPHLDSRTAAEIQAEEDAHLGVKTSQAAYKVYGKYSKWSLFIGIGLSAYIYSLDGVTTPSYLTFAASFFGHHSFIASIQTAQQLIGAIASPVVAKLADVTSRSSAYCLILLFYVLGYIVTASAGNVGTVAGGLILYQVGYSGLPLLNQILIADTTTLKWRALVSSLIAAPFIVNAFIGSNIVSSMLLHSTWKWGYGMFAILLPATLAPLILSLVWAELKAKKLGLVEVQKSGKPFIRRVGNFMLQLDVIGLFILAAAISLILLPLSLVNDAEGWKKPSMIAMLVVGCVLLVLFFVYDLNFAPRPVVPPRFVKNRVLVCGSFIGFFDFISYYISYVYLYSYVFVVKPWSLTDATYFNNCQTVGLTVFGILAGLILRYLRYYKLTLILGLCLRLFGVGLMIHSRGANGSDAEIVMTQIIQSIGGGLAATSTQVAVQASVPHFDVAMATAVTILWTEIGGSVGNAIAGAIWRNTMPQNLAKFLPDLPQELRDTLFGSITMAAGYPLGDPTREGVISAYGETMKIMIIVATVFSVPPIIFAFFMPDLYLGDTQNAVDAADLSGEAQSGAKIASATAAYE